MPLSAYAPTNEQQLTIGKAKAKSVRDCMHRFSLDWKVSYLGAPPDPPYFAATRIGELNEKTARSYGYRPAPYPSPQDTQPHRVDNLPGAVQDVLMGKVSRFHGDPVPSGGCRQEAERSVVPGTSAVDLSPLWEKAYRAVESDSRLHHAEKEWNACMTGKGHKEVSPETAQAFWLEHDQGSGKVSSAEIATAVSDARCRKETGYTRLRAALERHYENQLISENRRQLAAIKLFNALELKNATRILKTGGE
ncbi:hypothetical protein [Streptomyces sp. NPDC046759]|uniref:hypothetical protein n=1 Tax=Streptomyces sp. NPDC046759 TaxID=3155019 RepID=UPI0033FE8782